MHVLRLARSLSDQKGPKPKGQQSEPLNLVLKSMVNWFQQVALWVMLIKIAPKYILKAVEISCNSFNKSSLRQLGGQKAEGQSGLRYLKYFCKDGVKLWTVD